MISVSDTLKEDFNTEIIERKKSEKDKSVIEKIDSILNIETKESGSKIEQIKLDAKNKIAHGDIDGALKLVSDYADKNDNDIFNTLILLRGQYAQLNRNKMMNVISLENANLQYNKITHSLLSVLDEI